MRWLLLILLLGWALGPPQSLAAQAPDPMIATATATVRFSDGIDFRVSAKLPEAAIGATLIYRERRGNGPTTLVPVRIPNGSDATPNLGHTLDTRVFYFPPGSEIAYRWEFIDRNGNRMLSDEEVVTYIDGRFQWEVRRTGQLEIFWYAGDEAFGDELRTTAQTALARLERQLGAQLQQPARIYVYADTYDLRSALANNEVEWVGGQAWVEQGLVVAAIAPGDSDEIKRIIPHELAHLVMHQATDNPYGGPPAWFEEGFAVFSEEVSDPRFTRLVDQAARDGELISLAALASGFPTDPEAAQRSYAQSADLVRYLATTYGEATLQQLVAAFAEGRTAEEGVQAALGLTIAELEAEWRATLPPALREPPLPIGPQAAPPERFANDPALIAPVDAPPMSEQVNWLERLDQQPFWLTLALSSAFCLIVMLVVGALLVRIYRHFDRERG